MSEDLHNEIQAINSIYSADTLVPETPPVNHSDTASTFNNYTLNLPGQSVAVRLQFAPDYPGSPPTVLGTQHVGEEFSKGTGARVVEIVRDVLARVFREGEVCLFDLLEEVGSVLDHNIGTVNEEGAQPMTSDGREKELTMIRENGSSFEGNPGDSRLAKEWSQLGEPPPWNVSEVVTEKKSVFIARAAPVSTPAQAKHYLHHLLCSDKKAAKATHNITAWRIKGEGNTTFQDCDDDGETAAGGRLLHLMQVMNLWDVMVVVTRWYGGVQLGPDRFRIINSVARDAFVRGGIMRAEFDRSGGGKRKGKK